MEVESGCQWSLLVDSCKMVVEPEEEEERKNKRRGRIIRGEKE